MRLIHRMQRSLHQCSLPTSISVTDESFIFSNRYQNTFIENYKKAFIRPSKYIRICNVSSCPGLCFILPQGRGKMKRYFENILCFVNVAQCKLYLPLSWQMYTYMCCITFMHQVINILQMHTQYNEMYKKCFILPRFPLCV